METYEIWDEMISLGKHPLTGVVPHWDSKTLSEVPPGRPHFGPRMGTFEHVS